MSAHQPDTARPSLRRVGQLSVAALAAAIVAVALLAAPHSGGDSSAETVSFQSGPAADKAQPPQQAPQVQHPVRGPAAKAAAAPNPVTPGNFTGYGFDQCVGPTQAKMDAWMQESPYMAVGIYISGASRGCRSQPNLTRTWVSNQLRKGWKLLPITLGPQASCSARYPKYGNDPTISANPSGGYITAVKQGYTEAARAIIAAQRLGIVPGSTLFYDLEAFDINNYHCKHSAIRFVHGWTQWLHLKGYKSGFYSSAGSGIKMLDWLRSLDSPFKLPDTLWIARWDNKANVSVSSSYLAQDAWMPHSRVKQYRGGHKETWGGVTINIDSNYLKLGPFNVPRSHHCGGVDVDLPVYNMLRTPTATYKPKVAQVKALQCLLSEWRFYRGPINGSYDAATRAAAMNWQAYRGFQRSTNFTVRDWASLFTTGAIPTLKLGSTGLYVRRIQRALHVLRPSLRVPIDGIYGGQMWNAINVYRKSVGLPAGGVMNDKTWRAMQAGKY